LCNDMEDLFRDFTRVSKSIKEYEKDLEERKKDIELTVFQFKELEGANLLKDEEKNLDEEILILSNAEKLRNTTRIIYDKLYGSEYTLYSEIHSVQKDLQDLSKIDERLREYASSAEEIEIKVAEIAEFLLKYSEDTNISPQRLEEVNARLSTLTKLHRKYGCKTNQDLIELMGNLQEKLKGFEYKDEKLTDLREQFEIYRGKLKDCATRLSRARKEVTTKLEKLIIDEFNELGMEKGKFHIAFQNFASTYEEKKEIALVDGVRYTPRGIDEIDFLFSANPGEELKSLSKIASGGEISRIMLALKNILASVDKVDSLVFDEVDTGIGGKIAGSVGRRLKKLSRYHQVLAVTHLAQIAAFADNHIKVEKYEKDNKTCISVEKLIDKKKRISEISRMLSGDLKSDTSLKHAEELMQANAHS
ncbi:hypothetical protein KKB18_10650, partial [bacterium]|nr:hypothetical protein [bacterium]